MHTVARDALMLAASYVYPTDPSTVYLCGAFWSAPLMGTDSQAGTLVHESYVTTSFPHTQGTRLMSSSNSGLTSAGTVAPRTMHMVRSLSMLGYLSGELMLFAGQTDAKKLAIANPARAIFNADSHEYYAENTPALA